MDNLINKKHIYIKYLQHLMHNRDIYHIYKKALHRCHYKSVWNLNSPQFGRFKIIFEFYLDKWRHKS